jgi:DNA mismatch endonuclease (patch repair protein)
MSRIRGKDTNPEISVRRWLWVNGYRYRLHKKNLPGRPDIVLKKYRAVIFVHGCFWHRHGCRFTTTPKSHTDFWLAKFRETIERDRNNIKALMEMSWRIMVIWECALGISGEVTDETAALINGWLTSDSAYISVGDHINPSRMR